MSIFLLHDICPFLHFYYYLKSYIFIWKSKQIKTKNQKQNNKKQTNKQTNKTKQNHTWYHKENAYVHGDK